MFSTVVVMGEVIKEYILYVDPTRCLGCRACEIACAVEHSVTKNIYTAILETPKPKPRAAVIPVDTLRVPTQCRHCENAPCMAVCPTGAISKTDEGFIVIDETKCIGCEMCVVVCPFGHPIFDIERKVVIKCDGCVERFREGKVPACVEACPTGALMFGRIEEIVKLVRTERAKPFLYEVAYLIPELRAKIPPVKIPVSPLSKLLEMYKPVKWY